MERIFYLKTTITLFTIFILNCLLLIDSNAQIEHLPSIPQIPVIVSGGNIYHVSKSNGADNELAGSEDNPFKTIQYGVDRLSPGDTLIVHESTTPYKEQIWINCAGNSSNYIQIKGADGEQVILSPPENNEYSFKGFAFTNLSGYIYLSNFEITGKYWAGINLRDLSHHIVIDKLILHDNKYGMYISGANDIFVRNSEFYNNNDRGVLIQLKSKDILFENVSSHDNMDDGFGLTLAPTTDGRPDNPTDICKNVYLTNCTSYNNADGIDLGVVQGAVIKNCRSFQNIRNGIKIWGPKNWIVNCYLHTNGSTGINPKPLWDMNVYIVHNTIVNNVQNQIKTTEYNEMYGVVTELNKAKLHLYNNIIVGQENSYSTWVRLIDISNNGEIISENNNLIFSEHDDEPAFIFRGSINKIYYIFDIISGNWKNSETFSGDKTFVDYPYLDDFILLPNSPAINRGTNVGVTDDIIGQSRLHGLNKVDIGAFEYPPPKAPINFSFN